MAAASGKQEGEETPRRRRNIFARIVRSHDFARDITVTTLGVLIALGIGEIVDEIRWRFRIDATDKAMLQEAGLLHGVYKEKQAVQPCVDRRLSEIAEILAEARRTGQLPDIRNISYPPDHGAFGDSWQLALNSGILLHMDPVEVMNTATVWANGRYYSEATGQERDAFDALLVLENRRGPVSSSILDEAELQLTQAEISTDQARGISDREREMFERNKVPALFTATQPLDTVRLKQMLSERNLCRPLLVDGQPYQLKGPIREQRRSYAG